MKNPFAKKSTVFIERALETNRIISTFTLPPVTDQIFILTGPRGSGKTVLLNELTTMFDKLPDWLVLKATSSDNLLVQLAENLGLWEKGREVNRIDAIDKLLAAVDKEGMKVLVAIDEVTNTPQMQTFASAFQLWISNNRPIYFLATGLYDEIMSLQDERNLTFLYRAPKILLTPLNQQAIANSYREIFGIDLEKSIQMAQLTKGYPFAFQTLGYVCWEKGNCDLDEEELAEFDQLLADAAYSKMWSELSELDQRVMTAIAENEGGQVKEFREALDMNPNLFNQYRRRLKNQGLINTKRYGTISFTLPRFAEFVKFETY